MRARMFVPVVTLLAALLPFAARASTTSGGLALSPAHGAPGSHFMATFTFTEAPCNAFAVYFYWDAPNPGLSLGGADATGAGPTCEVSMELVVPSTDAVPNHAYPVGAYAQTKQVNAGNSSTVMSTSRDSGSSQFEVTGPPSSGSPGGPTPSAPNHGTTTASTPAPSTTGPAPGPGAASTSAGVPGTSPSPDAADGSSSSTDNIKAPPLAIQPPQAPASGGIGGTILAAGAALLALLIAAAWTYRTGKLRTLLRR